MNNEENHDNPQPDSSLRPSYLPTERLTAQNVNPTIALKNSVTTSDIPHSYPFQEDQERAGRTTQLMSNSAQQNNGHTLNLGHPRYVAENSDTAYKQEFQTQYTKALPREDSAVNPWPEQGDLSQEPAYDPLALKVQDKPPKKSQRKVRQPWFFALMSLAGAAFLLFHRQLPPSNTTILLENFLPWFGLLSIPFVLKALFNPRAFFSILVLIYPVVSAALFLPDVIPNQPIARDGSISVLSANIDADNKTPMASINAIIQHNAEVVGIVEYAEGNHPEIGAALDKEYPYSFNIGTVGLWSKFPLSNTTKSDIDGSWGRVVQAEVSLPQGNTRIYLSHMGSYRPWEHSMRDDMLSQMTKIIQAENSQHLILLGDFNATKYDRSMSALAGGLSSPHSLDAGFNFTWPAVFPATAIDHVLYRGFSEADQKVIELPGSDHRGLLAHLR